jgi:hypothetical protein
MPRTQQFEIYSEDFKQSHQIIKCTVESSNGQVMTVPIITQTYAVEETEGRPKTVKVPYNLKIDQFTYMEIEVLPMRRMDFNIKFMDEDINVSRPTRPIAVRSTARSGNPFIGAPITGAVLGSGSHIGRRSGETPSRPYDG